MFVTLLSHVLTWTVVVAVLLKAFSDPDDKKRGTLSLDSNVQCVLRVFFCEALFQLNTTEIDNLNKLLTCFQETMCLRKEVQMFWFEKIQMTRELINVYEKESMSFAKSGQGKATLRLLSVVTSFIFLFLFSLGKQKYIV
ncbi:hypothetical protein BgiMline_005901 [Biomphalaria glabrata]|nr:hypothetical protein BgiMline_003895 [Biomphalaria glabrata]